MRPIFSFDIYICMYLLENQELSEKDSSFPGRVLEMLKWFHLCNGGLRDGSLRGVGRRNRRTRRQEMGRTRVVGYRRETNRGKGEIKTWKWRTPTVRAITRMETVCAMGFDAEGIVLR